jgi:hypothetical protein
MKVSKPKKKANGPRMAAATFDLFDAPLVDAYGYFHALPAEVRFLPYRREFSIDPKNWAQHRPPDWVFSLKWREYRYADIQQREDLQSVIPENKPGIYIFYTRPDQLVHRFPQFAFYVGISNERNTGRPLRERLKEYVPAALPAIRKRKNVHRMLQMYYGHIWVAFALTSVSSAKLRKVEEQLHGFVHPCFARRDFPPGIKHQQQAFGAI